MKNIGSVLAALFVVAVLLLYICTFQVRFTEVAIRKTWNKPDSAAITEPGLQFKWPRPIQTVVKYDKRIRILDVRTEETRTIDGKNLLLSSFTLWRIADPAKFHTNFASEEIGMKKLRTTVVTHSQAVTGQHVFGEFVSTDPSTRKIRAIEDEIRTAVAKDAKDQYGIEVVDFGIKKLALPQSVTVAIFAAMKENEKKKASKYTAEGLASASAIQADASAARDRIMAEVRRKVAQIRTEADRVVSAYYKEFDEYPYLRIFLDSMQTAREALSDRTTLVLSDIQPPFDVFNEEARRLVPIHDGVLGDAGAEATAKSDVP